MRNVPFWKSMTAPMQIISEKGERREPSGEGLRRAELVREETEKEHADRTDERHVEGHTKAHDLAVAEMR